MSKNYRFRTEVGVDKEVRLKIDQDFDFLEILSLKLRQEDIYDRFCADYGVIAGRVVANSGFGVPNVNVSVFIPLDEIDENDPIISTLYPYKTIIQKNEDGYRYNLLPYVKEYDGHTPTGTFPTREDLLTRKEVLEVYEKYYKFTVRTNSSGDFMIVGAPLGTQQVFFDIDLSNIGEFSLRPADLIRMGMGVPTQFRGDMFKSSEDLDSLPQIIKDVRQVEVSPFWGQEDLCDVGITRIDLDLRDLGIEITPHSVFMGSLFSTSDDDYIKSSCRPKRKMGSFCSLTTGPGTILALRQTIEIDSDNRPVLEQYVLEEGGNIIDENGTWLTDLPMNMNYVTTDEFGQQVITPDPTLGIPTTAKYRFKVKWQDDGGGPKGDIKRANYLIPNLRERGWTGATSFENTVYLGPENKNSSYAFSLDWNDYYDVNAAINCEDTFYKFQYNKVYSVASHIDRFKFGDGRNRHIGITRINDTTCQSENNRFPVNEAIKDNNFMIQLMTRQIIPLLHIVLFAIIPAIHILAVVFELVKFIIQVIGTFVNIILIGICAFISIFTQKPDWCPDGSPVPDLGNNNWFKQIALPMLSYPACDTCECDTERATDTSGGIVDSFGEWASGVGQGNTPLFPSSTAVSYNVSIDGMNAHGGYTFCYDEYIAASDDGELLITEYQPLILCSGYDSQTKAFYHDLFDEGGTKDEKEWYKSPVFPIIESDSNTKTRWKISPQVTWSQALNLMNRRSMYFDNGQDSVYIPQVDQNGDCPSTHKIQNTIQVKTVNDVFGPDNSSTPWTDICFIMLVKDTTEIESGNIFTFNDPNNISDPNINVFPEGNQFGDTGITGTTQSNENSYVQVQVPYIKTNGLNGTAQANLVVTADTASYKFKSGVEYFQAVTAMTVADAFSFNSGSSLVYDYIIHFLMRYKCWENDDQEACQWSQQDVIDYVANMNNLKIVFGVRGVDVHTPRQKIRYDLSELFNNGVGYSGDVVVEGDYFMNIPIQPNNIGGDNGQNSIWREDELTPTPHHEFDSDLANDIYFNNSNNNGTSGAVNTKSLYHKSYTLQVDPNLWTSFNSKATNKYVSIDKQFAGDDTFDNWMGSGGDGINVPGSNWPQDGINIPAQQRIEGCGYQYTKVSDDNKKANGKEDAITVSPIYKSANSNGSDPATTFDNYEYIVFRSDRIPVSDNFDTLDTNKRPEYRRYGLHLNTQQLLITYSDSGEATQIVSTPAFVNEGFEGDAESILEDMNQGLATVLSSLDCQGMVPWICYTGCGTNFGVTNPIEDCGEDNNLGLGQIVPAEERVVDGCYMFIVKNLIFSIPADWLYLSEWKERYKVMYAVCQGLFAESFQNNWVNGTLYLPPFQRKTLYFSDPSEENFNEVDRYQFCGDNYGNMNTRKQGPVYFNSETNSFYYRSTPYIDDDGFIGQETKKKSAGKNDSNIWFPTTIVELGPRDEYANQLSLSGEFDGYIVNTIPTSSYKSNSAITTLFVISRIAVKSWLAELAGVLPIPQDTLFTGINRFFTRTNNPLFDGRVDGDFAQMLSINSEYGITPYIDGNYSDSIAISKGLMGIYFDGDTNDRRILTNGTKTLTANPLGPANTFGYPNTQEIPYYMWQITGGTESDVNCEEDQEVTLFGSQKNNWSTEWNEVESTRYQGDDFFNGVPQTYMIPDDGPNPNYGRGHIYNADDNGNDSPNLPTTINPNGSRYKVGGPFHFYFGLKRGKSAINRYIKKYIFPDLNG